MIFLSRVKIEENPVNSRRQSTCLMSVDLMLKVDHCRDDKVKQGRKIEVDMVVM